VFTDTDVTRAGAVTIHCHWPGWGKHDRGDHCRTIHHRQKNHQSDKKQARYEAIPGRIFLLPPAGLMKITTAQTQFILVPCQRAE
jgi:hypothetical protein